MFYGHVLISSGCKFESSENMSFTENISIGRNSFFCATGGSIKVGSNVAFNSNFNINLSVGSKILIVKMY